MIQYQANDDFGLTRLVLHMRPEATNGSSSAPADNGHESRTFEIPLTESAAHAASLPVQGEFALPLAELELAVGDRVVVTCEAVDYRGGEPGIAAISEPVTLLVADTQTTLQAILAPDAEAERLLNSAIENELGLGRSE
jgi:hypothetical protein